MPAARTKVKTYTAEMVHDDTTKGAERFKEVTDDPSDRGQMRNAYFRKELFKELGIDNPADYEVTVVTTFTPKGK